MNENILQGNGRAKETGRTIGTGAQQFRAEIDFRRDPAGPGEPERTARMCVGVVRDPVAARENFGDELGILLRVFADDEERGPRWKEIGRAPGWSPVTFLCIACPLL